MQKQRVFPWIQGLERPKDAPHAVVAQCDSYGMAARVALASKQGGPWTDSWLADRIGVSRGYLCRVLKDQQPMPEWMLIPLAYATGSNLPLQYDALQRALRTARAETERDVIRRLAQLARPAIASYSMREVA
jgi:hypothetical protein